MLFEADGIKDAGGENWIPICLPGFNKKGYLYMYVSFLDQRHSDNSDEEDYRSNRAIGKERQIAIVLISANKESFYELREMKENVVKVFHTTAIVVTQFKR